MTPEERLRLEALDDKHVWHPFTPHSIYREEEPLMVVAGEGAYLIDAHGNRLDRGGALLELALIGDPVAHSMSPPMHEAALRELVEDVHEAGPRSPGR